LYSALPHGRLSLRQSSTAHGVDRGRATPAYTSRPHWRHLVTTTERSVLGSDATLRQITLTTCFFERTLSEKCLSLSVSESAFLAAATTCGAYLTRARAVSGVTDRRLMSGSGADGRKSIRRRSSNTALQHVFAVMERTRATESAHRRRRANTPAGRATDIANYLSLPAKLVRIQHERDGRRNGLDR